MDYKQLQTKELTWTLGETFQNENMFTDFEIESDTELLLKYLTEYNTSFEFQNIPRESVDKLVQTITYSSYNTRIFSEFLVQLQKKSNYHFSNLVFLPFIDQTNVLVYFKILFKENVIIPENEENDIYECLFNRLYEVHCTNQKDVLKSLAYYYCNYKKEKISSIIPFAIDICIKKQYPLLNTIVYMNVIADCYFLLESAEFTEILDNIFKIIANLLFTANDNEEILTALKFSIKVLERSNYCLLSTDIILSFLEYYNITDEINQFIVLLVAKKCYYSNVNELKESAFLQALHYLSRNIILTGSICDLLVLIISNPYVIEDKYILSIATQFWDFSRIAERWIFSGLIFGDLILKLFKKLLNNEDIPNVLTKFECELSSEYIDDLKELLYPSTD